MPVKAALAPFSPADKRTPVRNLPGCRANSGTETFNYCLSDIELVCEIYWQRGEPKTWDDPGYPDQADLQSARVAGVEIISILSADQIEEIETAFLEQE